MNIIFKIIFITFICLFIGCQGTPSKKPPIHLNPNMDSVERYDPQSESTFFNNKMTMRTPVEGTIARGELKEDINYYFGKDSRENFISDIPFDVTETDVYRGQERYEIFCTPCHGVGGDGNGIVTEHGYPPSASMHSERILDMTDGKLFDIITNGGAIMPSYGHQIHEAEDRWAIVAYVRALQKHQQNKLLNQQADEKKDIK